MRKILLTIIIPIHRLDESSFEYLKKAIASLRNQADMGFRVLFVVSLNVSQEDKDKILAEVGDDFNAHIEINTGETDYQSQVNFAVHKVVDTDYFAVLQLDDTLKNNYIKRALEYIDAYPNFDLFAPLCWEFDKEESEDKFIGFSNEAVWSIQHMEKFGIFDIENTKKNHFFNYNLAGAIVKAESFIDVGSLKVSMTKFHDYEFLLRMLNSGKKAMVIPKFMYNHINGREGSIHDLQKDMPELEKKFWYDMARKEYFFDFDREKKYEPSAG